MVRALQSRAEPSQGKEGDDKASDTFPFHRQQGRGKKIGHCLKQMGKTYVHGKAEGSIE